MASLSPLLSDPSPTHSHPGTDGHPPPGWLWRRQVVGTSLLPRECAWQLLVKALFHKLSLGPPGPLLHTPGGQDRTVLTWGHSSVRVNGGSLRPWPHLPPCLPLPHLHGQVSLLASEALGPCGGCPLSGTLASPPVTRHDSLLLQVVPYTWVAPGSLLLNVPVDLGLGSPPLRPFRNQAGNT